MTIRKPRPPRKFPSPRFLTAVESKAGANYSRAVYTWACQAGQRMQYAHFRDSGDLEPFTVEELAGWLYDKILSDGGEYVEDRSSQYRLSYEDVDRITMAAAEFLVTEFDGQRILESAQAGGRASKRKPDAKMRSRYRAECHGMSKSEAAKYLGVSTSAVAKYRAEARAEQKVFDDLISGANLSPEFQNQASAAPLG